MQNNLKTEAEASSFFFHKQQQLYDWIIYLKTTLESGLKKIIIVRNRYYGDFKIVN